jgi:hypothetical protein
MPRKWRTIDPGEVERLRSAGLNGAEIAKSFGVTEGAISKVLKKLNLAVKQHPILQDTTSIMEARLDMAGQLMKINNTANELLDLVMSWARGDKVALQVLESRIADKKVRVGDKIAWVKEFKMKDPREIALRAMAEIRGQIHLQMEIVQGIADMEEMAAFQKEVLDAIGSVSPEIRKQIIERLKERRFLRSTLGQSRARVLRSGEPDADREVGADGESDGGKVQLQQPRIPEGDPDGPLPEESV